MRHFHSLIIAFIAGAYQEWLLHLLRVAYISRNSRRTTGNPSCFVGRFAMCVPSVISPGVQLRVAHPDPSSVVRHSRLDHCVRNKLRPLSMRLNDIHMRMSIQFPELRLIQYDCGECAPFLCGSSVVAVWRGSVYLVESKHSTDYRLLNLL